MKKHIKALTHTLLKLLIVAPLKQLCSNKASSKSKQVESLEITVFSIINHEVNLIKEQFPEHNILLQNVKNLPFVNSPTKVFITSFSQAFTLVLRNACIHTQADSPIIVIGERKSAKTFISILNYGQNIPNAEIENILNSPSSEYQALLSAENSHTDTNKLSLTNAKLAMEGVGGSVTLKSHKNVGLLVTLGL